MNNSHFAAIFNILCVPKIGSQKVRSLVSKFTDANGIFSISEKELCSVDGIDQKSAKNDCSFR